MSSNAFLLLIRVNVYALIFVFFMASVASPALIDTISISSKGTIATHEVTIPSGSAADIQAAVNQMNSMGGGTVYLPAGTFYFNDETVQIPGGVNVIGAGIGKTILRQTKAAPFNYMFYLDARTNNKSTRVSGIQFEGLVTSSNDNVDGCAIFVRYGLNFRIDHCKFIDFPEAAISVTNFWEGTNRGVIDHNIIDNPYKDIFPTTIWGYGIVVAGKYQYWEPDITKFLGKYETAPTTSSMVYVEDNTFSRCRHAIASNQAAWYVFRYNNVTEARQKNFAQVDVHGSAGEGLPGGRGSEVYNNIIIAPVNYYGAVAMQYRGGGGVVFNNTFINQTASVKLLDDSGIEAYNVNDLYIWDNIIQGGTGTLVDNMAGYVENQDYFLYERPSYVPYSYPHPLTVEAAP
jgi:hypothetical protein